MSNRMTTRNTQHWCWASEEKKRKRKGNIWRIYLYLSCMRVISTPNNLHKVFQIHWLWKPDPDLESHSLHFLRQSLSVDKSSQCTVLIIPGLDQPQGTLDIVTFTWRQHLHLLWPTCLLVTCKGLEQQRKVLVLTTVRWAQHDKMTFLIKYIDTDTDPGLILAPG